MWPKQNNPHYKHVEINTQALNELPVNGTPTNLLTVETNDDDITHKTVENDVGPPTDNSSEDTVYNNLTEMSSFLPVGEEDQQELAAVRNSYLLLKNQCLGPQLKISH